MDADCTNTIVRLADKGKSKGGGGLLAYVVIEWDTIRINRMYESKSI